MIIHVVRAGESLWSISRAYGISIQRIIEANGIRELPHLIPGQALIIPSVERTYTVQAGDTLWSISRRFNVPVDRLMEVNHISNPNLINPGTVIRIPEKAKNFGSIEVNAFIEHVSREVDIQTVNEVGRYLTYISPFSYQVNSDGSLNPLLDEGILETARRHRVAPMMVITNFRGGNFDTELVHGILTNDSVQQNLIRSVLDVLRRKNYYALNIDFERIPPEDRERYNSFLRKVVNALRSQNYPVSTSLAPKPFDIRTGPWHGAHDYRAHGQIVDFVILMTYEWGWSGGPPMAVAPINEVKRVIDYAVTVIPPRKIMMGMPLYGYDWVLPYMPGGEWAQRVGPQEALMIAARFGVNIQYDEKAQSPFFNYTDRQGARHVVWFEDARSVRAKFELVNQRRLKGVSYWVLGVSFTQNWEVLDNLFRITKIAT